MLTKVEEVRLKVGDIEPLEYEFDDQFYEYWLLMNSDDVDKAAVDACKALVAKYANAMDEVTNEVEGKWTQRYEGYIYLLYRLEADLHLNSIKIYCGGLSKSERVADRCDSDLRDSTIIAGQATSVPFYRRY